MRNFKLSLLTLETPIARAYKSAHRLTDRTSIHAKVPLLALFNIPPTKINREFTKRVNKQAANFNKNAESLNEITVFVTTENIIVPTPFGDLDVEAGFSIGDGNTRLEYWKKNSQLAPATVTIKFVLIRSGEEYETEYYSYDSSTSCELNTDKITGALSAYNIDLRTSKGKRGSFGESMRYAYAGDSRDNVLTKVKYFETELPIVDRYTLNVDSKELKQQTSTLTSAFLIALKMYSTPSEQRQQLLSMMKKVSTITFDNWQENRHPLNTVNKAWDGAQLLMREAITPKHTKTGTKRADYENTLDFNLYCIDLWMRNKFIKQVNPGSFEGLYMEEMVILGELDFACNA